MGNLNGNGSRRALFNTIAKGAALIGTLALTYRGIDYTLIGNNPSMIPAFTMVAGGISSALFTTISVFQTSTKETLNQALHKDHWRKGLYSAFAGLAFGAMAAGHIARIDQFEKDWSHISNIASAEQAARYCSDKSSGHRMIVDTEQKRYKLTCPTA
jgi:hypothetical protein